MTITLAPMEGVVDHNIRHLLTRIGGYDLCVTEFLRVSHMLYPEHVFFRICPELASGGRTAAGTPVHLQLMGGEAGLLAENAARAAELGAPGIDLNFGCPAKTVNRRDAGASLLQWPERLEEIVAAVRRAVPDTIPVSAKMRLGFSDTSLALDNARAIEAGGASRIVVHARTKVEGYKPPAHWDWLARIREAVSIPMVANGDIRRLEDGAKIREVSGCEHIMIGRGAMACPDLARQISCEGREHAWDWGETLDLLLDFYRHCRPTSVPDGLAGRIKQWLNMMRPEKPEAEAVFLKIRTLHDPDAIAAILQRERGSWRNPLAA